MCHGYLILFVPIVDTYVREVQRYKGHLNTAVTVAVSIVGLSK